MLENVDIKIIENAGKNSIKGSFTVYLESYLLLMNHIQLEHVIDCLII